MIVAIMIKQPYQHIIIPTHWESTYQAFENQLWRHLHSQTPMWFQFEDTKTLITLPKGVPIVALSEIQTLQVINEDKLRNEIQSSLVGKPLDEPDTSNEPQN